MCGGVGCPKLVEALEAGLLVYKYTFIDIDANVHVVVRVFVRKLRLRYPHLLPVSALHGFDARLPHNVRLISNLQLANFVARHGPIDMFGAGFPCQPFSAAGPNRGIQDARFQLFFEVVRMPKWF